MRLAVVGSDLLPSRSRTGREPSSARTQGAHILVGNMGATEDAVMRRFAAAAPPTPRRLDTSRGGQARGDSEYPIYWSAAMRSARAARSAAGSWSGSWWEIPIA